MVDPLGTAVLAAGAYLADVMKPDIRAAFARLGRGIVQVVRDAERPHYPSPAHLLSDLRAGQLRDGQRITINGKPSPFGPFLRRHFLNGVIGMRSDLRLGPPIAAPHPIMAMVAQVTTHLMPVGLYPAVGPSIVQGCLYPAESSVCGVIGPFGPPQTAWLPLLMRSDQSYAFGVPSRMTGVIRILDAAAFEASGLGAETFESARQQGGVWLLDTTEEEQRWWSVRDSEPEELWGALYATGHLELGPGTVRLEDLVAAIQTAIQEAGFSTSIGRNQAQRKEVGIFSRGIRAVVDGQAPIYSLHMDVDVSKDFGRAHEQFSAILSRALRNLGTVCASNGVELGNAADVDFTYANATSAYSVLRSLGADAIHDPTIVAVREWHRMRNA